MTQLQKRRYEAIKRVMKNYGINYNGKYIMSLWDFAFSANNIWLAPLFLSKEKEKRVSKSHEKYGSYSISEWQLHHLFTGIKHGARGTDIEVKKSKPNDMLYLICDSKVIEENK